MKNNKLISLVLALLVCLSLAVSASAANESDLVFTLESPDSNVEPLNAAVVNAGDTVTVNVNIEKNPGFLAAVANVKFDAAILEFVSAEDVEGVLVASPVEGRVNITIGDYRKAVTAPDKAAKVEKTGKIVSLTFKVLATEDKNASIEISASTANVIDTKGACSLTVAGDKLDMNVVGANHKCNAENTVNANNGKEATCTEEGKESDLRCAHCGDIVKEGAVIPAKDHAWDNGVETKAPTCTDMGVITFTCGNCGETKVDDKVPAIGHSFGDWTVTKQATVDAEGEETRTCANCQAKETRAIAKLPAPAPAPAKSNTGLIIAIVVVVVLAGAGAAAFFVLKNKKK